MGLMVLSRLLFLGGMYVLFLLLWWILQIIANWRIFTKAGEAGWKSLIPVYSDYVSYRIAWHTSYFWLTFILGIISSVAQSYIKTNGAVTALSVIVSLIQIVMAIISILYSVKLSKAFGHGIGFAIGLIFLQPIFLLILGLGSDTYCGADQ